MELPQASKPEIEERPLSEEEEAQKEPNPAKCDSDASGTNLEQQTRKNMERRRKAFYLDGEEVNSIPERRSQMMNTKKRLMKGEVHIVTLNSARKPPIKKKDPTSQGRRLPRIP